MSRLTLAILIGGGLLAPVECLAAEPRQQRLLLLGQGPDGHPATTHEYMAGLRVLEKCLAQSAKLELHVHSADEPWLEGPAIIDQADGAVLFLSEGAKWAQSDPRRHDALARLAARGGALIALHWGMGARDAQYVDGFLRLLGGCHGGPDRRYAVIEEQLSLADREHPIAAGIELPRATDEFYFRLKFVEQPAAAGPLVPVVTVPIEGRQETVCWAWERPGGGQSFGFSGLHFHDNWRHEAYRRLATQGVLWAMKLPIPEDGAAIDVAEDDLALEPAAALTPQE